MLEKLIAYHCGPALAGIKPANIASCLKSRIPDVHSQIKKLNLQLNPKGIFIDTMCECEKRVLVMVYRKKVLGKHLEASEMREFLSQYGYPENASTEEYIRLLKIRLTENEFPHEIGVFLGYPLHDIYGFINHSDTCLLTGDWKVYNDAEGAQKIFLRYKSCRNAIVKRMARGQTLTQIFCAV